VTRPRRLVARCVRPAGRGAPGALNVTPLVDVVLVLLIIVMVVTPLREEALRLRVPVATPAAAPRPPPVVVAVLAEGALALDGTPVPDAAYEDRLAAMLRLRPEGERAVVFAAADPAPYRRLVAALDGARRAGADALVLADGAAAGWPRRPRRLRAPRAGPCPPAAGRRGRAPRGPRA
jgi:biopolymer transport protein ExbD